MNTLFFVALIACVCAVYVTALPHPAELGAPESYDAKIENIVPAEEHQRFIRSRGYGGRGGGYGGYGGGRGGYGGYGGGRGGNWNHRG